METTECIMTDEELWKTVKTKGLMQYALQRKKHNKQQYIMHERRATSGGGFLRRGRNSGVQTRETDRDSARQSHTLRPTVNPSAAKHPTPNTQPHATRTDRTDRPIDRRNETLFLVRGLNCFECRSGSSTECTGGCNRRGGGFGVWFNRWVSD